jgi:hypothetical protein
MYFQLNKKHKKKEIAIALKPFALVNSTYTFDGLTNQYRIKYFFARRQEPFK